MGIARLSTVVLLVLTLGLHWAVLQTVAWTGMVMRYSQQGSVRDALSRTFDGKHPCALCKAIEKGREAERQQRPDQEQSIVKLELALPWQPPVMTFHAPHSRVPGTSAPALARPETPPTPPPRAAGVEAA